MMDITRMRPSKASNCDISFKNFMSRRGKEVHYSHALEGYVIVPLPSRAVRILRLHCHRPPVRLFANAELAEDFIEQVFFEGFTEDDFQVFHGEGDIDGDEFF